MILKGFCVYRSFFVSIGCDLMNRLLAVLSVLAVILSGCDSSINRNRDIFAMDTYMNLKAYGENAENALDCAVEEINRLEALLSVTDKNSEIYKLNNSESGTVSVSDDVREIMEFSVNMGRDTDGALDITVYPLLKEWGFTTGEYKIPDNKRISELLQMVSYSNIYIKGNNVTVPNSVQIDLGAVAKGYTSDRISEIFKENGIESAIINLGGNVHVLGKKPDGSMWNVAVTNPFDTEKSLGVLKVSDKAVVTSGNYERYFTGEDGRNYCHIINTATGYPAENGLVSVTVTGDKGVVCDALSTAFFVMGREKTEEYLKNQCDVSVILVEDSGNIVISEEISNNFQNLSGFPVEVIYNET